MAKLTTHQEIKPEEESAMQDLWDSFYKHILWKQQQIEDARHPQGCTMTSCFHERNPMDKTAYQEMWMWDDYVHRHYRPPQVSGKSLAETFGS